MMTMKEQIVKQQEYFAKYQKRINEQVQGKNLACVRELNCVISD